MVELDTYSSVCSIHLDNRIEIGIILMESCVSFSLPIKSKHKSRSERDRAYYKQSTLCTPGKIFESLYFTFFLDNDMTDSRALHFPIIPNFSNGVDSKTF